MLKALLLVRPVIDWIDLHLLHGSKVSEVEGETSSAVKNVKAFCLESPRRIGAIV